MVKLVVAKLSGSGKLKKSHRTVVQKRVRGADGKLSVMRTLDGESKTFSDDLTYVFSRNVAKARRENKKVIGAADRVPAKG